VGDRRSRSVGAGIEFAQYRDYEPGDDLRHLDRHVYARFGRTVIRQFHLEQRLRVSVILDCSGSMGVDGEAWEKAVAMAAVFGTVALNGSDQVRFGVMSGSRVDWSGVATRDNQLARELSLISAVSPKGGNGSMAVSAARSLEALAHPGMLVVISDWLVDDYQQALKAWHVRGQEIVAVQVLGAAEAGDSSAATGAGNGGAKPTTDGWLRLIDAETGETLERLADASTWRAYRAAVAAFSEQVRSAVWSVEGRWLSLTARGAVDEATVRSMRGLGLVT
jgi:uncharacterized protein (DUF58 family)